MLKGIFGVLRERWGASLAWRASEWPGKGVCLGRTGGRRKLCMVPCHSCRIYGAGSSKEVERVLKSSYGGVKKQRGRHFLWVVDPLDTM